MPKFQCITILLKKFRVSPHCIKGKKNAYKDDADFYVPINTIKLNKFVEHADNIYKYNKDTDTWVNCAGADADIYILLFFEK